MKKIIIGFIITLSLPVLAAVLWPSGAYLETFQNGFIFGSGKVLSALNSVITFDDKRLDDRNKDIVYQEDFEGAFVAADFACDASLTGADETVTPIKGLKSFKITEGAATIADKCTGLTFPVALKERGQLVEKCIWTTYDGNDNEWSARVFDVTNSAYLDAGTFGIRASVKPLEHCFYFNTQGTTASIRYDFEVATVNNGAILIVDDVQYKTNPLAPTNVYASSDWEEYPLIVNGMPNATGFVESRRDGTNLKVRGRYASSTGLTAALWGIALPTGLSIGGGVPTIYKTPNGRMIGDTGANINIFFLVKEGEAATQVGYTDGTGAVNSNTSRAANFIGQPSTNYTFEFEVPIAGWSDSAQGVVVVGRTDSSSMENDFAFWVTNNGTAVISEESIVGTFGVSRSATGSTSITYPGLSLTKIPSVRCTSDDFGNVNAEIKNVTTTGFDVRTYIASSDVDVDGNYHCAITKMAPDYIKETERTMVFPNGLDQPTCYISEHKSANVSSNVGPAYAVTNVFTPRRFNTTNGSCFFLSLTNGTIGVNGVANNITLKRGSYNFDCTLPSYVPNKLKSRIRSAGSSLVIGTSAFSQDAANGIDTFIKGNVAADTDDYVVTIEQWQSDVASGGGNAYGVSVNVLGEVEVYSQCSITKVR